MRWSITHRPQDLPRSKHILAEGKTLEEVTILSTDDFIGVTQKPESCEETIEILFGLQHIRIYPNPDRGEEKFCNACEDAQVLEYMIHLSLIHI